MQKKEHPHPAYVLLGHLPDIATAANGLTDQLAQGGNTDPPQIPFRDVADRIAVIASHGTAFLTGIAFVGIFYDLPRPISIIDVAICIGMTICSGYLCRYIMARLEGKN